MLRLCQQRVFVGLESIASRRSIAFFAQGASLRCCSKVSLFSLWCRSTWLITSILDARFPVLPRWFTDPIHEHLWHRQEAQAKSSEPSHIAYIPTREISQSVPHAYSLLEELYNAVFESRFVNRTPSGRHRRDNVPIKRMLTNVPKPYYPTIS